MKHSLFVIALLSAIILQGCKDTEYITVPEKHVEHVYHTDSIKQVDSIITDREIIIMQLDSAAMAHYGIQLQKAERAWVVKTRELEQRIQQLQQLSAKTDTIIREVPVPYEVVKEVPAKLRGWQKTLMWIGATAVALAILLILLRLRR